MNWFALFICFFKPVKYAMVVVLGNKSEKMKTFFYCFLLHFLLLVTTLVNCFQVILQLKWVISNCSTCLISFLTSDILLIFISYFLLFIWPSYPGCHEWSGAWSLRLQPEVRLWEKHLELGFVDQVTSIDWWRCLDWRNCSSLKIYLTKVVFELLKTGEGHLGHI